MWADNMTDNVQTKRVVIIGGGITGLSAAFRLSELCKNKPYPLAVTLFEARNRLGGVIHTFEKDGFLIDAGPDNFVTAKPWAMALARRLGIDAEIISTNEAHRSALVVRNQNLLPIPEGFLLMAPTKLMPMVTTPLFSIPGKFRMAMEFFLPARQNNDDESLASFVTRRFGQEALDRVVQPLISGIYTARPEKLSLRATMPRFLELERQYGSVIRGMQKEGKKRRVVQNKTGSGARYGMFVTFKDGLRTLVEALQERLGHVDFHLNTPVSRIDKGPSHSGKPAWTVKTRSDLVTEADGLIIAGPSKHAAALMTDVDPVLADALAQVRYASSAVAHLAYRREQISHPLNAFGCVVPMVEKLNIIAASFSSVKYDGRAPNGHVLIRAFMGGALQPEIIQRDDQALADTACNDLNHLLGIASKPLFAVISRWPHSMAQYDVGHLESVEAMRKKISSHKTLQIAGNGFDGVGIPDCVRAGEQAAEAIMADLG
jgi:protoporphyrinogen/coproporphyrinogen III oxidase